MSVTSPEPSVTVGVPKETMPGEQRVAVVPESVPVLARAGIRVLVEPGAGAAAWFPDDAYERAGAKLASRDEVVSGADVLVGVGMPAPELIARLRAGQAVIGMLRPLVQPELARQLARAGVTAISLDGLPRTVSRAQSMDALTSQANVAGYKAVLVAADHFGRFFPMLITAAGTSRPANVLVLGAGVAGLQAMGTARRLGAVVTGYDIRPETREQIESVGARLLQPRHGRSDGGRRRVRPGPHRRGAGRPAGRAHRADRPLRHRHHHRAGAGPAPPAAGHRRGGQGHAGGQRARRPGREQPRRQRRGLGGGPDGADRRRGRIIGAGNLPAQVPTAASTAYSHNIVALLAELVHDGALRIDPADEIQAGVVVTHQGTVLHPAVAALLGSPAEGGSR